MTEYTEYTEYTYIPGPQFPYFTPLPASAGSSSSAVECRSSGSFVYYFKLK